MLTPKHRVYTLFLTIVVFLCTEITNAQAPASPDPCLVSYFKTYRSEYDYEYLSKYCLVRNNRQLLENTGYKKLANGSTVTTKTLRLLDAQGNFIKSVDLNVSYNSVRVSDKYILLCSITPFGGEPGHTLTLVDDDLNIVWTRGIKTQKDFYSVGSGVTGAYVDEDNNLYILATSIGFGSIKGRVTIYKVDATGKEIWTSVHEIMANDLMTACITASPAGLIVVVEGFTGYSFLYNKNTGDILKSYTFPGNWDRQVYYRHLNYENGTTFYASGTANARLLVGTFDSVARPTKMKYINELSIPRGASSRNGFMVISVDGSNEVLLKFDTSLTIKYMNEYAMGPFRINSGIGIDAAGYVYSGGVQSPPGFPVYNPYLAKFGQGGEIGSCLFKPYAGSLIDIPFIPGTVGYSRIPRTYELVPSTVLAVPSTTTLDNVDAVCIEAESCINLSFTDPGAVCNLKTDQTFQYTVGEGCNATPAFSFDTSYLKLVSNIPGAVTFKLKKAGTTKLVGTLQRACMNYADTLVININDDLASLSLGADTSICPGDSIVLRAGENYSQYAWQDGSTDNNFIAKFSGKYGVMVTNSCGESQYDEINIVVPTSQVLLSALSITTCANDSFKIVAESGFSHYKWESGSYLAASGATATSILSSPALITASAISATGCLVKDTIAVDLKYPRPVNLGKDTTLCYNASAVLIVGPGYSSYSWSDGSAGPALTAATAGKYFVSAQDHNGCYARDSIVVSKFKAPLPALGSDRNLCSNQPIELSPGNFVSYTWQDGSVNDSFSVISTGRYWVSVKDQNNCIAADTIEIQNLVASPSGFLKISDSICNGRTLELYAQKNYRSYLWSNGSTAAGTTVASPGDYKLAVTDENGCSATETIRIVKKDCVIGIFIPTAFSPNHDGVNDAFRPIVHGRVVQYSMTVYNRYGGIVYSTNDPAKSWDGFFKGKPADIGNYVWRCSYQFEGGPTTNLKGHTLLIR